MLIKANQVAEFYKNSRNFELLDRLISNTDIVNLYDEKVYIVSQTFNLLYTSTEDSIISEENKQLLKSINFKKINFFYFKRGIEESVVIKFYDNGKELYLINSAKDFYGFDKVNNLRTIIFLGNIFTLFLTLIFSVFFSDNLINPLKKIISDINGIAGNEFGKRLKIKNNNDELAKLSQNFNNMLARMEEVHVNQKNFISHASHELRTPLANTLINLETTLLQNYDLKKTRTQIKKSISQLNHCIELTNGLLQLAYINKEMNVEFQKIRLDDILLEEISWVKSKHKNQKINFNIDFQNQNQFEPVAIEGNKNLISICIRNLLDNACKYSKNKLVSINLVQNESNCEIQILDNGIGIPESELSYLTEPLFRATNSKQFLGFGIGLSLVKRIIDLHKGDFFITSKIDIGTEVRLRFYAI